MIMYSSLNVLKLEREVLIIFSTQDAQQNMAYGAIVRLWQFYGVIF